MCTSVDRMRKRHAIRRYPPIWECDPLASRRVYLRSWEEKLFVRSFGRTDVRPIVMTHLILDTCHPFEMAVLQIAEPEGL